MTRKTIANIAAQLGLAAAAVLAAAPVADADQLSASRIARCQELVGRALTGAQFEGTTWKVWDDPVPKKVLTPAALANVRPKEVLYDGGVTGMVRPKSAGGNAPSGEIFAFCSFDNLFIWLQGLDDGGRWTAYGRSDDILPY